MSKEQYVHHSPWDLNPAWVEAKRGCLKVEVIEWPEAGGGRSSSNGRRDERLITKAEYAELVGDEV